MLVDIEDIIEDGGGIGTKPLTRPHTQKSAEEKQSLTLDPIEDFAESNVKASRSSSNGIKLKVDPSRARRLKESRKNEVASPLIPPPSALPSLSRRALSKIESLLSWRQPVYLHTWGCSHNNSDSEYMAGLLLRAGYTITEDREEAALWLLNSCTVKTPSESQLKNEIERGHTAGKRVVVAGCVAQASSGEEWLGGDGKEKGGEETDKGQSNNPISLIGVQQIDRIVEVVDETLKGNSVRLLSQRRPGPLSLALPKMRRNSLVEVMAVSSGCLNHCTYCKTKQARGDLRSFPLEALVEHARDAFVRDGCKELWLTSEDLGAWGRDLVAPEGGRHTLPDLLDRLVEVIPEGCMMRLGMTNPPYILDHLEEVAAVLNHPRVYAFLHIPVQSGSDAVLADMRREYTREHFCRIVDYMVKRVPGIYIATDFICAFPTESEEDFEESMELVRLYKFPSLFINQFYPRAGTPAARLKLINTAEARRRTKAMSQLFRSYSRYERERIGSIESVLICERASDGRHLVGHNKFYEHILVPPHSSSDLMGKWHRVRIVAVAKFHMTAELVDDMEECAHMRTGLDNWCQLKEWASKAYGMLGRVGRHSLLAPNNGQKGERMPAFLKLLFLISAVYFVLRLASLIASLW